LPRKRRRKTGVNGDITSVAMRDANGFHVDVAQVDALPRDMTTEPVPREREKNPDRASDNPSEDPPLPGSGGRRAA